MIEIFFSDRKSVQTGKNYTYFLLGIGSSKDGQSHFGKKIFKTTPRASADSPSTCSRRALDTITSACGDLASRFIVASRDRDWFTSREILVFKRLGGFYFLENKKYSVSYFLSSEILRINFVVETDNFKVKIFKKLEKKNCVFDSCKMFLKNRTPVLHFFCVLV